MLNFSCDAIIYVINNLKYIPPKHVYFSYTEQLCTHASWCMSVCS